MAVLENLEPKKVFHFFEEVSEVPRGTFNIKESVIIAQNLLRIVI